MADNTSSLANNDNQTMDYPRSFVISLHVIGIPLGVAIIVGNVLFVVVLKLSNARQQKAFKSKTALVLANISLCDAVGGLLLLVYIGISSVLDSLGRSPVGCYLWIALGVVPLVGCFLLQLLLAVERHVIVNEVPNYPHMNRLVVAIVVIWIYTAAVGVLSLAFMSAGGADAYDVCDVLSVSPLYFTAIVCTHVVLCTAACTVFIFLIRNTVKHHQCKIQVSNTIAYTNLIEDSQLAKTFFVVSMATFLCWLAFFVCQIMLVAGIWSRDVMTSTRWSYLLGHVSYLKCYCYAAFSRPLREDVKRTFGKTKKRPFRMGTIVREG